MKELSKGLAVIVMWSVVGLAVWKGDSGASIVLGILVFGGTLTIFNS